MSSREESISSAKTIECPVTKVTGMVLFSFGTTAKDVVTSDEENEGSKSLARRLTDGAKTASEEVASGESGLMPEIELDIRCKKEGAYVTSDDSLRSCVVLRVTGLVKDMLN